MKMMIIIVIIVALIVLYLARLMTVWDVVFLWWASASLAPSDWWETALF